MFWRTANIFNTANVKLSRTELMNVEAAKSMSIQTASKPLRSAHCRAAGTQGLEMLASSGPLQHLALNLWRWPVHSSMLSPTKHKQGFHLTRTEHDHLLLLKLITLIIFCNDKCRRTRFCCSLETWAECLNLPNCKTQQNGKETSPVFFFFLCQILDNDVYNISALDFLVTVSPRCERFYLVCRS